MQLVQARCGRYLFARILLFLASALLLSVPGRAVGQAFTPSIVESGADVGLYSSIGIDSGNGVHIAYFDLDMGRLRYAARPPGGSWSMETVDATDVAGFYCSLALDEKDEPHISYYAPDAFELRYASKSGTGWSVEGVEATGTLFFGSWSSIQLDGQGMPRIAYVFTTADNRTWLQYAAKSGSSWQIETVDSDPLDLSGFEADMELDAVDVPHISFTRLNLNPADSTISEIRLDYANRIGGSWTIETVDSSPTSLGWSSLELQGPNPRVAYLHEGAPGSRNVVYALKGGGAWQCETVDVGGGEGDAHQLSLALTSGGQPCIAYYNCTDENLMYARQISPANWDRVTADATGDVGEHTSLRLDAGNNPHISYALVTRAASFNLKYAFQPGPVELSVSPPTHSLDVDQMFQFGASTLWNDGSVEILLGGVGWNSTNTLVATVDQNGTATALAPGVSMIEATLGNLVGRATLTVNLDVALESIAITPRDQELFELLTLQFEALGTLTDQSVMDVTNSVTWSSSEPTVATVSPTGLVTAVSVGETTIRAESGGVTGIVFDETNLTVVNEVSDFYPILTAEVWNLLSFPISEKDNSITAVLDELGPPDPTKWKLGHWQPASSTYDLMDRQSDELEYGKGYWLITSAPQTVFTTGSVLTSSFEIDLEGGPGGAPAWNQLGNPFYVVYPVSLLQVTDGANTYPLTSSDNNLTERTVKEWTGTTYVDRNDLGLGSGFWVRKLSSGPVRLIFPLGLARSGKQVAPPKVPDGAEWAVGVTARQGERASGEILVGSAPVAAGAWNPLDFAQPPSPPGPVLAISIPKRDWGRMNGDYAREFIPGADAMGWVFEVRGARTPGEVTLAFEGYDLPDGLSLRLSDGRSSWRVTPGEAISVAAAAGVKRLWLEALAAPSAADDVAARPTAFLSPYPNPFRERTGFRFDLDRPGDVAVSVFDASGRLVRSLSGEGLSRGEHVLAWDGRDERGRELAPGVYLARYGAGALTRKAYRIVKIR